MKNILILCGGNQSGKTKTLKEFFGVSHIRKLAKMRLLEKVLNGRKVYAVSLCAPQELRDPCDVEGVKNSIRKRTKKCEQASNGQQYTLIIPFGLYGAVKGKLNEDCILNPIEWLRSQGFRIFVIYLRKETARRLDLVNSFMKQLTSNVIESTKDYKRQSKELEDFIKGL